MTMSEPLPSNRKFGLLFVVVFALLGTYLWRRQVGWHPIAFGLSAVFLAAALVFPHVLRPLNRAWMGLALILNKIVSPVVLGVLFFILFTPVALFMRLRKRDVMARRFDPASPSYWIGRSPPGPLPGSFRDQF
jgi:hypothetical protein